MLKIQANTGEYECGCPIGRPSKEEQAALGKAENISRVSLALRLFR